MTEHSPYEPAAWLRDLARVKPARWRWGPSLRAALCVAGPLAAGLALDQILTALWISMGTLTAAGGEGAGTYRSRFRQMAIAAPIGASGYLAGHLGALPWPAVIAAMTAIAFLAGIVNSYGAAFSIGTMQFLLVAALALGLPEIAPFWRPALLFLAGVGLYAFVLWIETLLDRRRPERRMLADLIADLGSLARLRAAMPDGPEGAARRDAARRKVTDDTRALYATLIETRRNGRTRETVTHAEILDAADDLFVGVIAETDPAALAATAAWLDALSTATMRRAVVPKPPSGLALSGRLRRLAAAIATGAFLLREDAAAAPTTARSPWSLHVLAVGPVVLQRAAALALCIGAAYSARYFIHASHWYWVPLTVALVMKPDLGSIFVRAVLRSVGTSAGVAIGAALLILAPKGWPLVACIAALALVLPWAKAVSYGVQALVLTPLVLALLDLIVPAAETVDYGWQRLIDTAIGGGIVLILGYFIWPRRQGRALAAQFGAAMAAISDYLVAACSPAGGPGRDVEAARWTAYARLSDLRATLGRSMSEPPPAGPEAAAWFPPVAAAERICDRITAQAAGGAGALPTAEVQAAAGRLRDIGRAPSGPAAAGTAPTGPDFLAAVAGEAARIGALLTTLDGTGGRGSAGKAA